MRAPPEQVLVVSPSPLLHRRVERAVAPTGLAVRSMEGAPELVRCRRQRAFLLCFFDLRGPEPLRDAEACFRARPGERYVLVRGPWDGEAAEPCPATPFGYLREPFSAAEVLAWCGRASQEARLVQGGRSLDELLLEKFRAFLQDLGPSAGGRLHETVSEWVERPLLAAVLERTGGNQSQAAKMLGIHRNTLRVRIRALGLGPPAGG